MDIKDVAKEIDHYTYNVTDQAGNELSVVDVSDIMVVLSRLKLVKQSDSLPTVINRLSPYLARLVDLSYSEGLTSDEQDDIRRCTNMIQIEAGR